MCDVLDYRRNVSSRLLRRSGHVREVDMTESAHAPFLQPSAPSPADQSVMLDWLAATGWVVACLLYTSDAADDLLCVDLGGRRIIKKKKKIHRNHKYTS